VADLAMHLTRDENYAGSTPVASSTNIYDVWHANQVKHLDPNEEKVG
jgi:hypothetical protein